MCPVIGDCGSWVTDSRMSILYGHIIAGDSQTGLTFIVPAYKTLASIGGKFGLKPSFALTDSSPLIQARPQTSTELLNENRWDYDFVTTETPNSNFEQWWLHHQDHRVNDDRNDILSQSDATSEVGKSIFSSSKSDTSNTTYQTNTEERSAAYLPIRGILKKARDKFPEYSNFVREGVAPLEATTRAIPREARWTRINRRLVNPEALQSEGVRFEEGPDFVIVLKVLNQEEIAHYAQKTHEIREKRRQLLAGTKPSH